MTEPASPYDEEYYQKFCGPIPYDRSQPVWLQQFGRLADAIKRELRPGRVLDVGCAKGFLVECLWDRGIEARGTDISEVAIAAVRPDIRPFCKVARATDPIEERFDLVTCIEVLEHLSPEEARQALGQITSCTDAVLFSSTPSDLEESTHQNVRPLLSWVHEFGELGFLPDVLVDASFAAPHAMLFRRASSYDARQVDQLYVRVVLRTMQVVELTARLGADAAGRAAELERLRGELEHTRRDHVAVLGSRVWRLTYPFRVAMTAAKRALSSNGNVR